MKGKICLDSAYPLCERIHMQQRWCLRYAWDILGEGEGGLRLLEAGQGKMERRSRAVFRRSAARQPATAQCILHHTYLLDYKLTLQNTIMCPECSFLVRAVDTFWQAPPSAFQAMPAFVENKMLSMRWSFPTRRQTTLSHRHVTNSYFLLGYHVCPSQFH